MLYIVGLGLNENSISKQGLIAIKKCKKVYFENYTVDFPYNLKELEKNICKVVIPANRELVESNILVKEAKRENVCLLVYGSPLTATTHISLIQEAKKNKVKCEIVYNGSIFDAIAETGLQIYKFGKVTSMPKWSKSFKPTSFMEIVKQNQSIDAHSLILIDIGLEVKDAMEELETSAEEHKINVDRIILCSQLGTQNSKILYKTTEELKTMRIKKPYCIILPAKLHFLEEETLNQYV